MYLIWELDRAIEISEDYEDHKHIPFEKGHITWHSDEDPDEEIMQAFNEVVKKVREEKN